VYCKKCFSALPPEEPKYPRPGDSGDAEDPIPLSYATNMIDICRRCGKKFNRGRPASYLSSPFPSRRRVIFTLVATTLLGIFVALIVSIFQMPAMQVGGH